MVLGCHGKLNCSNWCLLYITDKISAVRINVVLTYYLQSLQVLDDLFGLSHSLSTMKKVIMCLNRNLFHYIDILIAPCLLPPNRPTHHICFVRGILWRTDRVIIIITIHGTKQLSIFRMIFNHWKHLESRVNAFWYCFLVFKRYTFHYLIME